MDAITEKVKAFFAGRATGFTVCRNKYPVSEIQFNA
jgi:hypothetical protein